MCLAVLWALQSLRPYIKRTSCKVRTDHKALKRMLTFNHPYGRLMRWRPRLSKLVHLVLFCLKLVIRVSDATSGLLHSSDTPDCEPIDDKISTFEPSSATLKRREKEVRVAGTPFSVNFLETISMSTRSFSASHIPVDDTHDNYFIANEWIIRASEHQALNALAVPQ